MGGFFGGGGGSTDPTGNPIPTGDTSNVDAGIQPTNDTFQFTPDANTPGLSGSSDIASIFDTLNPAFGMQNAMAQSSFQPPVGVDPSQIQGGSQQQAGGPVTSFQGNQTAQERSPLEESPGIQAIVNALGGGSKQNQGASWFQQNQPPQPRQTDPLSGSPHEGGFGFEQTPEQQVQSRYGAWPSLMPRPRPAEAPQFPFPQPRPPEAPQFPMPQPRPPEAPQPEQYGPPNPDTPTPVRTTTLPASQVPGAPPATTPPSAAPGQQQRPQNPIQAIFSALGIPPAMATTLARIVRQVGPNYAGGPLPGRQVPLAPPQQAARRPDEAQPETAPGTPSESQKFIMDRGGHPGVLGSEKAPDINPEFADRVKKAAEAYEAETGKRAEFGEMGRSHEQQRAYREEYLRTHQGLAAPEGQSRHEKGNAVDIPHGDFQDWMHRNASRFGINDLHGWQGRADPNHFQMDPNFAGGGGGGGGGGEGQAKAINDPGRYARGLIQAESGGNPRERTGSNRGLIQFGPEEERKYMSDIPPALRHTRWAQLKGLQRETADHTNILRNALGRDPTPGELYLTHQQGRAGGPALLKADANTPAWQAIRRFYGSDARAQSAIRRNIPGDNPLRHIPAWQITSGQFRNMWNDQFSRDMGQQHASQAMQQFAALAPAGDPNPFPPHRPARNIDSPNINERRNPGVVHDFSGVSDATGMQDWYPLPNTHLERDRRDSFEERFQGGQ